MTKEEFKTRLATLTYDKMYQDIEYIDMIGYSKSYETWDTIKDIIEWEGKSVADLGCFHGYFAFKIAQLGGTVIGLDRSPAVLETTEILNECYGSPIRTQVWVGGDPIPENIDVTLCLNVLHHFEDQERAIMNMRSKHAVFEVKYDQSFIITQYFDIIEKRQSKRQGRIILLGERREL